MIDPNEAPPGCVAVEPGLSPCCFGCVFHDPNNVYYIDECIKDKTRVCHSTERADGETVIFELRESQKRGTAEILADMEKLVAEMRRLM